MELFPSVPEDLEAVSTDELQATPRRVQAASVPSSQPTSSAPSKIAS